MSLMKLASHSIELNIEFGQKCRYSLKIPIVIPYLQCPSELAHRIIKLHNLAIYHHAELKEKLETKIRQKNQEFHRQQGNHSLENLVNNKIDVKSLSKKWGNKFSKPTSPIHEIHQSDFASMYHFLAHSCAVQTLLSLEHSYADAISTLVSQKEKDSEELRNRQSEKMQETVAKVGAERTDDDVNNLAARQLEDLQMLEAQWDSRITALKEQQKREFRNFILESFEGKEVTTPKTPKDFIGASENNSMVVIEAPEVSHEESFTIHLGTQMKQMHNLRLLSANVLDLLKYNQLDDSSLPPQRIQTSMSLYSYNLNGLVLLVDDRISTYSGVKKEFGRVSSRSTEFHFPELEDQLEAIRNFVPEVVEWRSKHPSNLNGDQNQNSVNSLRQHLNVGDFYVTKHSNLADIHVIYHLVTDDSLRSPDINSRHSVVLGLRNVLKVACLGDVTTLTVPLLLTHTLSEEMTIPWCQKRAELVFKCVKGFMMEMSSWGGSDVKNLQFLVPNGISDDLFQTLASMLQSIFRLSNPLIVKASKYANAN